jgi:hypothetical protein
MWPIKFDTTKLCHFTDVTVVLGCMIQTSLYFIDNQKILFIKTALFHEKKRKKHK